MKEIQLYPAGYAIRITTWENDGDMYKTKEISGLTGNEMSFVVKFAKLFNGDLGNLCDDEHDILVEGLENFVSDNGWELDYDYYTLMDKIGVSGSDFYVSRVVDKVKVFYMPKEVVVFEVEQ